MGAAAEPATESFGLKPEVKAPNISTMIESQFKSGGTGGWGAAADAAGSVAHEQLMEQYVKDKMGGAEGDKEGEGGEGDGAGAGPGGMLSEEDRLYTIPEEFKQKVGQERGGAKARGVTCNMGGERGEGRKEGIVKWGGGTQACKAVIVRP